ncbi:MAG TPA: DUF192 domain-containing protein [Terriglobales bacterium]|jgi:uncharacterized membrane protein (UPF0127 family)|nr:DUF192 domain-containing protein [Terriglobales bacterium]
MPEPGSTGYAFNRTRQAYLATQLSIAATHWTRLRGLMCTEAGSFLEGQGLWIVPSRGVHTFAMRFPIDVVYLDDEKTVVHLEQDLKPWRVAALRMQAASVIELPRNILHTTGTSIGDEIEIVLGREANAE